MIVMAVVMMPMIVAMIVTVMPVIMMPMTVTVTERRTTWMLMR